MNLSVKWDHVFKFPLHLRPFRPCSWEDLPIEPQAKQKQPFNVTSDNIPAKNWPNMNSQISVSFICLFNLFSFIYIYIYIHTCSWYAHQNFIAPIFPCSLIREMVKYVKLQTLFSVKSPCWLVLYPYVFQAVDWRVWFLNIIYNLFWCCLVEKIISMI